MAVGWQCREADDQTVDQLYCREGRQTDRRLRLAWGHHKWHHGIIVQPTPAVSPEDFLPTADTIARSVWLRGGRTLDLDDLKGQAALIVTLAIRSHDPERGSLEAHVRSRIQYDLIDYIRKVRIGSRHHHDLIQAGKAEPIRQVPITILEGGAGQVVPVLSSMPEIELKLLLRDIVLTKREQRILKRTRSGETRKSIGRRIRLTEGRISQILADIIRKIQQFVPRLCRECGNRIHRGKDSFYPSTFCNKRCSSIANGRSRHKLTDEKILRQLYLKDELSTIKIAAMLGCGVRAVNNALRRFKIKIRPAKVMRTKCLKCPRRVYKNLRCRRHYNLYQQYRALRYRKYKGWTPEKRQLLAKRTWETRRKLYGRSGGNLSGWLTPEQFSERSRKGHETRRKNTSSM
jgi:RNA polymerase sigma factor (sigma-70 family)